VDGLEVVLDEDHWKNHILKGHPELIQHRDLVIETLKNPEGVYRSKRDPTTRIYARSYPGILIEGTPVERINLRVVVSERNGFVATAYFAVAMWRGFGERIWPL
jgi:hypothetical protein